MEDCPADWVDSLGMDMDSCMVTGGVPIPRPQQLGSSHHNNPLHGSSSSHLGRTLHPNFSMPASVSDCCTGVSTQYHNHLNHLHMEDQLDSHNSSPYHHLHQSVSPSGGSLHLHPLHHSYTSPSPGPGQYTHTIGNDSPSGGGGGGDGGGYQNDNCGFSDSMTGYNDNNIGYGDSNSMGLSPLPPHSPSPHMWQAQSMDLDVDLNIRMDTFDEMINMDSASSFTNTTDPITLLSPSTSDLQAPSSYFDDLLSTSNTTCLDPQHSSEAAMTVVRPNEVLGLSHNTSGSNSVSSFPIMLMHSNTSLQQQQQQQQQQAQQNQLQQCQQQQHHHQSHSFPSVSFLSSHMACESPGSSLFGSDASYPIKKENLDQPKPIEKSAFSPVKKEHLPDREDLFGNWSFQSPVKKEESLDMVGCGSPGLMSFPSLVKKEENLEMSGCVGPSSFPPPYSVLRDPFLNAASPSSLPNKQPVGVHTHAGKDFSVHHLAHERILEELFQKECSQHPEQSEIEASNERETQQQQLQQLLQQKEMLNPQQHQQLKLLHQHLQQQQPRLQHDVQKQDQQQQHHNQQQEKLQQRQIHFQKTQQLQLLQHQQNSLKMHNQNIFKGVKPGIQKSLQNLTQQSANLQRQLQQQLQHRQHLIQQQQLSTSQPSLFEDMCGQQQSCPLTPNNTPVQSHFPSTLKEMLQSPATSISSPISPHSACSPVSVTTSPIPISSPANSASSPLAAHSPSVMQSSCVEEPHLFISLGGSNPTNPLGSGSHSTSSTMALSPSQQHSPQYILPTPSSTVARLSSSAPAPQHMLEHATWRRREPRVHLLSTGSVAEEQTVGSLTNSILSPDVNELSIDESGLDSDENYDSDSDNESLSILEHTSITGLGETPANTAGTSSGRTSTNNNTNKERHFWQYNVQAKGPKGQRMSSGPRHTDPHQLLTVADPVFSSSVGSVQGIKHSGKARRGDGNDLSPNPMRLVNIGKALSGLNKEIMDMTPVSEQPFHIRPSSRKEKNKLASRACRLKKKAQHEANKIKLYGLGEEHKVLLQHEQQCRALLLKKLQVATEQQHGAGGGSSGGGKNADSLQKMLTERISAIVCNKPFQIAGQTADFVNTVIDNCRSGRSNGGLDDLVHCMRRLRTTSSHPHGDEDTDGEQGIRNYMADFD